LGARSWFTAGWEISGDGIGGMGGDGGDTIVYASLLHQT
jgi:hypothetical protein